MTSTVVIWPRGVRTEVPVDVCRCPVLTVGDACPVHQQILPVPRSFIHGNDRVERLMNDPDVDVMRQLYLTKSEIAVLLISMAQAVTPRDAFGDDIEITQASRIVWESPVSTQTQRSLATALAEALH